MLPRACTTTRSLLLLLLPSRLSEVASCLGGSTIGGLWTPVNQGAFRPDISGEFWSCLPPYNGCRSRFYRRGRGAPGGFPQGGGYPWGGGYPPGGIGGDGEPERQRGFLGMKIEGFEIDPNEDDGKDDGRDDDPGNFFFRKPQYQRDQRRGEDLRIGQPTAEQEEKENRKRERERFYKQFKLQVIDVNRTFKATKGGGEISFTALAICGNGNGVAGFGKGKAKKASNAVKKACRKALSNLHYFERYKGHTIYQYAEAKYGKTKVRLWPEWSTGLFRAGNIVASILRLAGFKTIKSKLIGNAHPHNTVKATFLALSQIETAQEVKEKFWRAVVERHLVVDADGNADPHDRKHNSWVL